MAWYDDPEEVRRVTARALGVSLPDVVADQEDPEAGAEPTSFGLNQIPDESRSLEVAPKEWWEEEGAVEAMMDKMGVGVAEPMRSERSTGEEISAGLARGTDQTQGLLYGFTGLLGQALGVEDLEQFGLENYVRKMEEAAQNEATIQNPFEDADGIGDLMTYATGLVAEQIPQLALSIGGAGIGGVIGKAAARRIIANEVSKRTLAGMGKNEAAEEVAKQISENAFRNAGAGAGAYLANFGQVAGGSFGQIAQETGEGDAAAAAGFAVPGAALDTLGEIFIAGKFLKPFTRTGRAAAEGVDTATGISFPGRVARSVATGLPAASAIEGTTEYIQTGLEQAAVGAADPNTTIEDRVLNLEAERQRQVAGAAGATVGGILGGAGSVIEALAPQTAEKLRQLPPRRPEQQGQAGQEQPPEQIAGGWMDPVKVASRDEAFGQIDFRRNETGQIAAFNVPEDYLPELPRVQTELGPAVLISRAYKNGAAIRAQVNTAYAEKDDPAKFAAPPPRPAPKVEDLEDADLPDGDGVVEGDPLAEAAERRRIRDQEILEKRRSFAEASLNRPLEDAKGFVSNLGEGDQVSVISQDEGGNQFSIPMTFVRLNNKGQAQLRTEPDEENNVDVFTYDPDDFNLITPRNEAAGETSAAPAAAPVAATPRLIAPIVPAEGQELTAEERAQNLIFYSDEGRKIDENLWRNSARELGIEITEDMQSAQAVEMAVRRQFGLDRPVSKQSDPASEILIDALGPNPTRQKLEAITRGTPWTGPGAEFTWGVRDNLGGEIPVTTRLFNRKSPAEPLDIPTRPDVKGFKPEERGTRPAAPDIESKGPDLVATSRAQFVGVRDDKGAPVNQRPARGQDNATYLTRVDTAADTTIRQMNFLGQPVEVTPEAAQSLAEANQFWVEQQERQRTGKARPRDPVRFFTQERADKDGNRKTYVTGVTYEGRTYRVGKTPDDFTVDKPLTERGANSRRRGRGIYDNIRRASEKRKVRSEAGMEAREVEGGPLAAALTGVKGRPALPDLNEAENSAFGFYDARITGPLAEAQGIDEATRDRALEAARARLAAAFVKAKKAVPSEQTTVLPARQRVIGEKVSRKLVEYQDAKRFLALEKLREKFKALSAKTAAAKKGAKGTGAAKALKMSPQGAQNLITRAGRNQKVGLSPDKRATREEALQALQELVDFSALDQKKKDEQIRKILAAAESFTEVDRDFMSEQIIGELATEDRAIAAKQGRAYERTTAQVAADRRLVKNTFELLGSDSIRSLNPYRIGQTALGSAKRTATREDINRPTESLDDEESGVADEAAMQDQPRLRDATGPITQGKLAEKGRPLGVEGARGGQVAPFISDLGEFEARYDALTPADKQILDDLEAEQIERGGLRQRQIKGVSENKRLRAARVVAYLEGNITYDQLYASRTRPRPSGIDEYIRRAAERRANAQAAGRGDAATAGVSGGQETQGDLAGVAESRARRSPEPAPEGRPERVVGDPADAAGTVQGQDAGQAGGRGVQPTPFRTRTVAAAAQRDFAGALLGLNEAETAALPQAVVDRIYQAYLSRFDAKAAEQSNNALTATAAPMADAVTADGKRMFERYAGEVASENVMRARDIRQNMAQAFRAGLFDDNPVVSAINKIANDESQPRQLRLIAKEFVKNARRGVEFGNVVLDLGRFTNANGSRSTWAGLFGISPDGESVVSINLDNLHDQDSLPLSFLHELQHVVIRDKVRRRVALTRTEEAALNRLENFRRQAVIAAARDQGIEVGADPDINALANRLYDLTDPNRQQSGAATDARRFAGLVNLEEFVIEMIGNPDFVGLLAELGFGSAEPQGRKFSLTGALRDAWNAVVELITGYKVDPTSPLAMAFKDSWTINFGTSRNPNITEIKAGSRVRQREQRQMATDFINREIEDRNMAGTTRDRQAIGQEISGPADRSTEQAADRVREAATTLSLEEFVQWAPANGFDFVDPIAVYQSLRETPQQAARDTVQVAESRARGSQSVVVPDPELPNILQPKEYHKLNTITNADGDVVLDTAKLVASMKERASQVEDQVSGKKYLVIANDERTEFGTLPALKRFIENAGFRGGAVARVFRNGNNQIAVNFDENITQDVARLFNDTTTLESRARSRVLYHAGPSVLTPETVRFDRGAMGFHVGARTQAEWVSKEAIKDQMSSFAVKDSTDKFYTEDVDTDMSWEHADALLVELVSKGLINKEEALELAETWDDLSSAHEKALMADLNRVQFEDGYVGLDGNVGEFMLQSPTYKNREKLSQIRELLKTYAIGAINYVNEVEGVGGDSQAVAILDSSMLERPAVAMESRARRRAISETDTTITGKTYTRPGLFAGQIANLDPRGQELVEIKKRMEKKAEKFTEMMGKELRNIIKRTYKGDPVPVNLINDALGNLDNPLTDEQFEVVKRLEARDKAAAVKQHMAFLSENRERFRRERQAPALLALPEELAGFLREIGDELTTLQSEALRLGIPKGDMKVAFTENLGIYLTRSYAAFLDQEGWEKAMRAEDRALGEQSRMGQMRNQIRATMISERASEFMAEAMEQGRTLSRAEAERRASEGTTTEEVDQILETYIAYTKQEPSSETFSGLGFPGRQRLKDLKNRKVLSDALRQFYGQTENPAVNFTVSYMKLSTMLANHKFQDSLRKMGLEEGWIWNPDDPQNEGQRPPPGFTRIAADSDKSLELLAGLFARQDLVDGLREALPSNALEESVWWLHPFMKYTGFSMGMKTVGSIAAQVRNYWSSYAPLIAGGNFTAADLFREDWRSNWKFAHQTALGSVFRNYGGNRKQMVDDIRALYELGVMGESVTVGLLSDLTQLGKNSALSDDEFLQGFEKYMRRPGKKVWDKTKQFWKKTEQVYGMTDDIFKIFTYLSELDKYRKVYPNKPLDELRRDAANRSRDIHWTYSKAPAIVTELKKFPFIAPFVTFTTETIRITLNIGRLAASERRQGQELRARGEREGNAELVRQGNELLAISNKRIRGMTAVALGPWAVGTMALSAAGLSGEDEEDLRQFLPDWQKNSQLIILGRNGSEVNYIDVSYLDPFEVWKKPMTAFMRGLGRSNNPEEFFTEAVVGAAIQAASPFTSEQILSGAVMDIMRNRDANGRQVYNPQDTSTSISFAVGQKLASAFAPGTYDTAVRVTKAVGGSVSETGRDYNFWNEIGGIPAGSRVSAVNAEQALGFKASQFLRARREARNIFNRDYLSQGTRSESDIVSAYQRGNTGLRDVTERLRREYRAALNLGVSPAKARTLLKAAGLDRETVRSISTGFYRRLTPSDEQNQIAPADRRRAVRRVMAETPEREVMLD
jgi:hypothetical protein